MMSGIRVSYILSFSIALILSAGCAGDKSKSQGASLAVNPSKPIVINADITDDNGKKLTRPWFEFRTRMTNNTGDTITIVALQADVYAQGPSGQQQKTTVAFTPSEFNFKISDTQECKFSNFGVWEKDGEKDKAFILDNGQTGCTRTPVFRIGSNPTGPTGNNFRYRVQLKPLGWFGTADKATDRFDRTFSFFTQ